MTMPPGFKVIEVDFGTIEVPEALDAVTQGWPATLSAVTDWEQIESAASKESSSRNASADSQVLFAPPTIVSSRGVLDPDTRIPPDTHGAVGPNHVVGLTNAGIQVFDRSGMALTGLVSLESL